MTNSVARKRLERVLLMASPRAMPLAANKTWFEIPTKWRTSPNPMSQLEAEAAKRTVSVVLGVQ